MQELTRFSKIEDVILIEENFTPEYKEIQSWLKSCFSYTKISIERGFINTLELNCISFDDISRTDKDRFKIQICPVYRLKNSDRALVKVNRGNDNSHLIIREIKDNSFSFYSTSRVENEIYEGENEFCDTGIFNLKYSEYEIVYCIINKLAKYRLFDDKEEFEAVYNFCKTLFDGTEKDFLTCLIHPYKLDCYSPYPNDYNKIEHYSDLKTCLLEIKNSIANIPVPPATEQQSLREKSKNVNEVITEINNAFFRLESFANGNIKEYEYFGFNDAFTILFNEVRKPKNYTIENCELIDKYWYLVQQISFDADKANFEFSDVYNNDTNDSKGFWKDCWEMDDLLNRVEEFCYFSGGEEEPKVSINDIIKNKPLSIISTLKVPTTTAQDQPKPETNLTDDQTIIYNHIKHLKRENLNREKIMTDENFNQLFNDLCYLVENNAVPEIKKTLSQIGVSNQSIIYTVRLIHKDLFTTTKIRPSFIEFLQKYFQQLGEIDNMKIAFSKQPPKKYPY